MEPGAKAGSSCLQSVTHSRSEVSSTLLAGVSFAVLTWTPTPSLPCQEPGVELETWVSGTGVPRWSSGENLVLSPLRARLQSLVGKLISHKPHSTAKKKRNKGL